MSESMIERVAKAIWKKEFEHGNCDYGTSHASYLPAASAAIEAVREPTAEMVVVFIEKHGYLRTGFWADAWNDGIDAALKEGE